MPFSEDDRQAVLEMIRSELLTAEQHRLAQLNTKPLPPGAMGTAPAAPRDCRHGYRSPQHPEGFCERCRIDYQRGGAGSKSEIVTSQAAMDGFTEKDRIRRAREMIDSGRARKDHKTGRWQIDGVHGPGAPTLIQQLEQAATGKYADGEVIRPVRTWRTEGPVKPAHVPGCDGEAGGICGCGAGRQQRLVMDPDAEVMPRARRCTRRSGSPGATG